MSATDTRGQRADIDIVGGSAVVDGALTPADVVIRGGRIVSLGASPSDRAAETATIDATGMIVAPGLIDLQCNGAGGIDVTRRPDRIDDVAAVLPRFGVTSFLPTVVTAPEEQRRAAIDAMRAGHTPAGGARALGLHLEGPAISPHHLGAHDVRHIGLPGADEVDAWIGSDAVRMVTIAPELDGALSLIEQLAAAGILVSLGHTAMGPAELTAGRHAGARCVTHLFNAMAPLHHRTLGAVGAVFADDHVVAGLICDGVHVDPAAVAIAWRALGPGRVLLVSDASAPLGQPYGSSRLGRHELIHDETGVRTVDGVLAGSALPLDRAVRNLIEFTGCDPLDALAAATVVPADLLGRTDIGRLTPGAHADLVLLDDRLGLLATIVGGRPVWSHEGVDIDPATAPA